MKKIFNKFDGLEENVAKEKKRLAVDGETEISREKQTATTRSRIRKIWYYQFLYKCCTMKGRDSWYQETFGTPQCRNTRHNDMTVRQNALGLISPCTCAIPSGRYVPSQSICTITGGSKSASENLWRLVNFECELVTRG